MVVPFSVYHIYVVEWILVGNIIPGKSNQFCGGQDLRQLTPLTRHQFDKVVIFTTIRNWSLSQKPSIDKE